MVVDVCFVLVLPVRILMRRVGVFQRRVVVVVRVIRRQVLHFPARAVARVVRHVNVVVAVNDRRMGVILEACNRHVIPPSCYPALVRGTRKPFPGRGARDGVSGIGARVSFHSITD